MTKLKFNHMLALASTMALMSGSQAVYAQQTQPAADVEEVVVTGFRRSIQNSLAAKQESTSVVEAIYAEDIGKLPDTSIAESLARLPGLAGERRDGRTSGISVRGFSADYVATTMNGRELLGIGDNRGIEYDLYPSEIVSGVMVYKTPDASLVNQGIGGIVDLKTIHPLDNDRIISINANYEQNGLKSGNPDFDDNGHRLAFTYSDKFADDTIGFAITAATMESPSQEEQFRGWGYADVDTNDDDENDAVALGGHDSYVRSSLMERDTISAVVQWQPIDELTVTVDALSIDFTDSKVFRGLEEGTVWGGANSTHTVVQNGLVTAGYWDGFRSVIRNDGETKDGELDTYGLNLKYQLNDAWELGFDYATSDSSKEIINIESYSGVGRADSDTQGDAAARSYVLTSKGVMFSAHPTIEMPDYSNSANIRLAGPQAWGGGVAPAFEGRNDSQDGFINRPMFDEELDTLRLQAKGEVEFSIVKSVEVGFNASDRTKSKINYGSFLTAPDYFTDDFSAIDGGDGAIPASAIVGTADLGFVGLGDIVAYDGIGLYKSGYYLETPAAYFQTDRFGDTYEVTEKVKTLYAMANIETGIMSGNVGLQIVKTDQSAIGFDTQNQEYDGTSAVRATAVKDGAEYTHLLPSMNLNFQLTDDQKLRFATSKTISRARMDNMKPGTTIGFNFDTARRESDDIMFSAWSGNAGNAKLKPIEVVQFDLSYEYYFADDGFVSIGGFYKDIQNWHIADATATDFSSYIIAGYHDAGIDELVSTQGLTSKINEAGKGTVQGHEIQVSLPFHLFSESLDGLGLIASGAFIDGQVENNGSLIDIPGLSTESYQLTVYFERSGFEFRVSGRDRNDFLKEEPGLSLALTPATDKGAYLVDAQIGYNFSESGIEGLEGLTVTLQGQNLTNEETVATNAGDSRQVTKYQNFGANYLLGVNYKF